MECEDDETRPGLIKSIAIATMASVVTAWSFVGSKLPQGEPVVMTLGQFQTPCT